MQRLTQAEMRYLKRNYRDYDIIIDVINECKENRLYDIFGILMYNYECVQLNEDENILWDICDNVLDRRNAE